MIASWVIFFHPKSEKVLILKRSKFVRNPNQWCFPGGSSRKHKKKRLAIKEAKEEVGIKTKDINLILKVPTKRKLYFFYIYFIKPKKANVILNYESEKYKWVKITSLSKRKNLHRSIKLFIKNYER